MVGIVFVPRNLTEVAGPVKGYNHVIWYEPGDWIEVAFTNGLAIRLTNGIIDEWKGNGLVLLVVGEVSSRWSWVLKAS